MSEVSKTCNFTHFWYLFCAKLHIFDISTKFASCFGKNKVESRAKSSLKAIADVRPVVDDLYAYVVVLLLAEEIATVMSDLICCHGDIVKGVIVEDFIIGTAQGCDFHFEGSSVVVGEGVKFITRLSIVGRGGHIAILCLP